MIDDGVDTIIQRRIDTMMNLLFLRVAWRLSTPSAAADLQTRAADTDPAYSAAAAWHLSSNIIHRRGADENGLRAGQRPRTVIGKMKSTARRQSCRRPSRNILCRRNLVRDDRVRASRCNYCVIIIVYCVMYKFKYVLQGRGEVPERLL